MTTMKPITLPSGEYLIIDVPEFTYRLNIHEGLLRWTNMLHEKTNQVENDGAIMLPIIPPESDWQLIGRESEITEEVAREIVEERVGIIKVRGGSVSVKAFVNYEYPGIGTMSALESLISLSKREGLSNPVWLKKV